MAEAPIASRRSSPPIIAALSVAVIVLTGLLLWPALSRTSAPPKVTITDWTVSEINFGTAGFGLTEGGGWSGWTGENIVTGAAASSTLSGELSFGDPSTTLNCSVLGLTVAFPFSIHNASTQAPGHGYPMNLTRAVPFGSGELEVWLLAISLNVTLPSQAGTYVMDFTEYGACA